MNKPKSNRFLIFGLFLGLLLGALVKGAEYYIEQELLTLMSEEAQAAGDFKFLADDLDVSLPTLSAKASNPRLELNGQTELAFAKLKITFDIKEIFQKKIYLSRLDLIDGTSVGVGPRSTTYRFIRQLTKPSHPEKAKDPNRWKVKLLELRIKDLDATDKINSQKFKFFGGQLQMARNAADNFILRPTIAKVTWNDQWDLGSAKAVIELKDNEVYFQKVDITRGDSRIDLLGLTRPKTDEIEISSKYQLNSSSYEVQDWLGQFQGEAQATGYLEDLKVTGGLDLQPDQKLTLRTTDYFPLPPIDLKKFQLDYSLTNKENLTVFKIEKLQTSNDNLQASVVDPLSYNGEQIGGAINFRIQNLNYQGTELLNSNATLELSGTWDDPAFILKGNSEKIISQGLEFPNTSWKLTKQESLLQVNLDHQSAQDGAMDIQATLALPTLEQPTTVLTDLQFKFQNYSFASDNFSTLQEFYLTGQGQLKDQAQDLTGSGVLSLSSRHFAGESALNGTFNFAKRAVDISLKNQTQTLRANFHYDLEEAVMAKVVVDLKDFQASEYNPDLSCIKTSLSLNYQFDPHQILAGTGSLNLADLQVGCNKYALKNTKPNLWQIANGKLSNINLDLQGLDSSVQLKGAANFPANLELHASGKLELQALTSLTPWLSDLRGQLSADLNLDGNNSKLNLSGDAALTDGEFSLANEELSGKEFNGKIELSNQIIKVNEVTGLVNNAPVTISGVIEPLNLLNSRLNLEYSDFRYEPTPEFFIDTSGEIALTVDTEHIPSVSAKILVNEAILNKEIGIGLLLNYFRDYLFRKKNANPVVKSYPDLRLNLQIEAKRNIFVISNLIESELKGQIDIQGDLKEPLVTGQISALYGWLGLRNSRFDITEGELSIDSRDPEPILNVLAETSVVNRIGEPIYITMEARGSLTTPEIILSSDSNLNQSDILTLLTTRGLYRSRSQSSTNIRERLEDYQIQEEKSFWKSLVSNFTNLDSVAIEPAFNYRTGLIEPSLINVRKINKDLALTSETFLGGSNNDTRFVANYDLTPRIRLTGLIDTISYQKNTALEFNTSFTLLAKTKKKLDIKITGETNYPRYQILEQLRINNSSEISPEDLEDLQKRLVQFYHRTGYFQADVNLSCTTRFTKCSELAIEIQSGPNYKIIGITQAAEALPEVIKKSLPEIVGQSAEQKLRKNYNDQIITLLRNEGYLQARVDSKYLIDDSTASAMIQLKAELGRPVSFIFTGNQHFTSEELLEKTNLLTNKRAFGNNSIHILISKIERIYRQAGFLFAVVQSSSEIDSAGRTIYQIKIIEEQQTDIIDVDFKNIDKETLQLLRKSFKEQAPEAAISFFHPATVITEELDNNIYLARKFLNNIGYPQAQISYQITPADNLDVVISYTFQLGDREQLYQLVMTGYPESLPEREVKATGFSRDQISFEKDTIIQNLTRNGFPDAEGQLEFSEKTGEFILNINAGQPLEIKNIDCQGNELISCQVITKLLQIKSGLPVSNNQLNSLKANLLKSGMFETVSITPSIANPENLIVLVSEKKLTALDLGFGINSELGVHIFSEASDRSLFLDGRSLSLRLDAYVDDTSTDVTQGVAGLRYQDPYFLDQNLKFSSDLGYQKFDNPTLEYDLDRVVLDQSLQRSWDNISNTFGYSFLNEQLDNVTAGAIISPLDQGHVDLSYFYGNLNIDLRNNTVVPDLGIFLGLDYKAASNTIGSDADFYSLLGRASFLLPVFDSPFTLANNFALGSSRVFNDTAEIPISQRFYLGGRNSLRGFKENSLGPRGADGAVIGGDLTLSNNLEIRYDLNEFLQLHTFYDTGNVFLQSQGYSLSDLRESAGVGFRFKSPIGPIGLDFGHPLDQEPGEPSWRIHFSVGSAF